MITCCEIALASIIANVLCLAMVRNYYVKMKGLTIELKKKNGQERKEIDDLKKEVERLKEKSSQSLKTSQSLKK